MIRFSQHMVDRIEREKAEQRSKDHRVSAIRIFVGCAVNDDLESQAVLEYSIRKNTKRDLEINWCQLSRDPASPWYSDGPRGWQTSQWTTPFSGLRWRVPELCGFEGHAIYTDSDVIFLADIGELWDQPIPEGKVAIAKGGKHEQRLCVCKFDCAAAEGLFPPSKTIRHDPLAHRRMMNLVGTHSGQWLGGDWNVLDLEPFDLADPRVKALHYTGIPTQLQLKHALPRLAREAGRHWYTGPARDHPRRDLQKLFDRLLVEATAAGYGVERYRREPFGQYNIRAGR